MSTDVSHPLTSALGSPMCLNDQFHDPKYCCIKSLTPGDHTKHNHSDKCCHSHVIEAMGQQNPLGWKRFSSPSRITSFIKVLDDVICNAQKGYHTVSYVDSSLSEAAKIMLGGMGYRLSESDGNLTVKWTSKTKTLKVKSALETFEEEIEKSPYEGSINFPIVIPDLSVLKTKFPHHVIFVDGSHWVKFREARDDVARAYRDRMMVRTEKFFIGHISSEMKEHYDIGQLSFSIVPDFMDLVLKDYFEDKYLIIINRKGDLQTVGWKNKTPGIGHVPTSIHLNQLVYHPCQYCAPGDHVSTGGHFVMSSDSLEENTKWVEYASKKYPKHYFFLENNNAWLSWLIKNPNEENRVYEEVSKAVQQGKPSLSVSYCCPQLLDRIREEMTGYVFESMKISGYWVISWLAVSPPPSPSDPVVGLSNHIGLHTTLGPAFLRKAGVTPQHVELAMAFLQKIPQPLIREFLRGVIKHIPSPWDKWSEVLVGVSELPKEVQEEIVTDLLKVLARV